MRTLKELLPRRQSQESVQKGLEDLDEKTIFYVALKAIRELYGVRGEENIRPKRFGNQKLTLEVMSSLWGNEVWLERERVREKINVLLGNNAVKAIKVDHS